MLVVCPQCKSRYQLPPGLWPAGSDGAGHQVLLPRKVRCRACQTVWMALPEDDILDLGEPAPEPAPEPEPAPGGQEAFAPSGPKLPMASAVILRPSRLGDNDDDSDDEGYAVDDDRPGPAPGRRWRRFAVAGVVALLTLAGVSVATGMVTAGPDGLPAFNWREASFPDWAGKARLSEWAATARFPEWAATARLPDWAATARLPEWADPAGWNIELPGLSVPAVQVPATPPPPLKLNIESQRREVDGRIVWNVQGTLANPTTEAHATPAIDLVLVDAGNQPLGSWVVRPAAARLAPGASTSFESSAIDPPAATTGVRATMKPSGLGRM